MERTEYERTYQLEAWHWWFVSRRRLATTLIGQWIRPVPRDRILDVGCGTGGNLEALQRWGWTTGLDLQPLPLNFARCHSRTELAQASVLALPYADNSFKLVTVFDVLYHWWVANDDQAMRELYRVTQADGWLLITDAAMPILWSTHDEIYQARRRYKLNDICRKLARVGFELKLCSYTNFVLLPIIAPLRLIMRWFSLAGDFDWRRTPIWLNKALIAVRDLEICWLRRKGTLPAGSSLICLARKTQDTGR